MKNLTRAILAAAVVVSSVPAMAQFQKPEDAAKYRQGSFTVMAAHFGRLGAMASGKAPYDAKLAQDNAAIVEFMSKLPWAGFTADSQSVKSKAKPEVWMDKGYAEQVSDLRMAIWKSVTDCTMWDGGTQSSHFCRVLVHFSPP